MARDGRPRQYAFAGHPAVADPATARRLAWLDELLARALDLVSDLDDATGNAVPEGGENPIFRLMLHMAAAERHWLCRLGDQPGDPDQDWITAAGMGGAPGPFAGPTVQEACRTVRAWSTALIAGLDPACRASHDGQELDLGGVLDHLAWHWCYHTGQVGLLRRLLGPHYRWRFDGRLAAERSGA